MSLNYFLDFFRTGNVFDLSHFLAQILGVWLIVLSLYTFIKHDHLRAALEEVEHSPSTQLTWALATFFMGLLTILIHQVWVWDWPVAITIIGWVLTIVGVLRLFFPDNFFKQSLRIFEGPLSYVSASFWLVIGVFLSWWGFHHP